MSIAAHSGAEQAPFFREWFIQLNTTPARSLSPCSFLLRSPSNLVISVAQQSLFLLLSLLLLSFLSLLFFFCWLHYFIHTPSPPSTPSPPNQSYLLLWDWAITFICLAHHILPSPSPFPFPAFLWATFSHTAISRLLLHSSGCADGLSFSFCINLISIITSTLIRVSLNWPDTVSWYPLYSWCLLMWYPW